MAGGEALSATYGWGLVIFAGGHILRVPVRLSIFDFVEDVIDCRLAVIVVAE